MRGEAPVGQRAERRVAASCSASASSAAPRPSSASTDGNRPCASSRRSATAAWSSSSARSSSASSSGSAAAELAAGEPIAERERDQALLRAVVQVALESAALGVGGRDDARARRPQLRQVGAPRGVQPLVLERQSRGGGDLGHECGVVEQSAAVHERATPRGPPATIGVVWRSPVGRRRGGAAVGVDPAVAVERWSSSQRRDRRAWRRAARAGRRATGTRRARRRAGECRARAPRPHALPGRRRRR